jgi:hypothetical protein
MSIVLKIKEIKCGNNLSLRYISPSTSAGRRAEEIQKRRSRKIRKRCKHRCTAKLTIH